MYTYVFAYYLRKNNQSEIFEVGFQIKIDLIMSSNLWCDYSTYIIYKKPNLFQENQKDLETATETLSEYLERDISAENLVDIKQKVQDKYR